MEKCLKKTFRDGKKSAGKPSGTEIRFSVSKLKDGRPRRNTCRCCSTKIKTKWETKKFRATESIAIHFLPVLIL